MECSHNIIVSVNEDFLFVGKDNFAATVFWKKDSVSNLHHEWSHSSVLKSFSWSDSQDCSLIELISLASRSKDNSSLGLGESFCLSDDNTIEKWSEGFEREHLDYL